MPIGLIDDKKVEGIAVLKRSKQMLDQGQPQNVILVHPWFFTETNGISNDGLGRQTTSGSVQMDGYSMSKCLRKEKRSGIPVITVCKASGLPNRGLLCAQMVKFSSNIRDSVCVAPKGTTPRTTVSFE
ncbi:uncharacterized protein MELLADRAFT_102067 [Melampsora larici-populina 98AG31]|uniref:Uncharacterized protein n=1 Tax=Melampsora larici-populina (strain 98AG31 / pathotype 3-4-7) TaxID=747676 RepID=F4R5W6_MELLP|nr:uncharacterized protein MELLADRAFT_102067 [Melampsora larici-populina 98AG31]EGG12111.1 hypothetical protein MELLADRAFT_102067 [Melampsora larici-populina 98AG31]